MLCCGDSGKKARNPDELLTDLKKLDEDVVVNLNDCHMTFRAKTGQWTSKINIYLYNIYILFNIANFKELPNADVEKAKDEFESLENTSKDKDKEIESLEKTYLQKIARLLVMTQVHCEIKTDINTEFDKLGLSKNVEEVPEKNQSFASNSNQKNAPQNEPIPA